MNSTLPAPKPATPFNNTRRQLQRIAIGLGLYVMLVLYPAFIALHWIYADTLPSLQNMLITAVCGVGFTLFAYRQMSKLSPPRDETGTNAS